MEILIYGLAQGETLEYMEMLLSTQCKTEKQINALITRAKKDGFHSFRIAKYNGEVPDFAQTVR